MFKLRTWVDGVGLDLEAGALDGVVGDEVDEHRLTTTRLDKVVPCVVAPLCQQGRTPIGTCQGNFRYSNQVIWFQFLFLVDSISSGISRKGGGGYLRYPKVQRLALRIWHLWGQNNQLETH